VHIVRTVNIGEKLPSLVTVTSSFRSPMPVVSSTYA
jgi:hypothetical protein